MTSRIHYALDPDLDKQDHCYRIYLKNSIKDEIRKILKQDEISIQFMKCDKTPISDKEPILSEISVPAQVLLIANSTEIYAAGGATRMGVPKVPGNKI